MESHESNSKAEALSSGGKIKQLYKKYGRVALGVHFGVYFTFLAGGYHSLAHRHSHRSPTFLLHSHISPTLTLFLPTTNPLYYSPGCYVAVDNKVDVRGVLENYGLLGKKKISKEGGGGLEKTASSSSSQEAGWMEKVLTGGSSTLALAFICNKALFPVRAPITVGLTPVIAKWLRVRVAQKAG
jgi:hypothetical protein